MGKFKDFLHEEEDLLKQITDILMQMDEDDIDAFGYYLLSTFFESEPEDEEYYYSINDVQEMIQDLGPDMYTYILDMLSEVPDEDIEDPEDIEELDLEEGVSRTMKAGNRNRKKRKFMQNSAAALRRTAASRKKKARKNKSKRKRYYSANKAKIKQYQKSRSKAIKAGKHIPKMRRKSG